MQQRTRTNARYGLILLKNSPFGRRWPNRQNIALRDHFFTNDVCQRAPCNNEVPNYWDEFQIDEFSTKSARSGCSPHFAPITASCAKRPFGQAISLPAPSRMKRVLAFPAHLAPFPVYCFSFPVPRIYFLVNKRSREMAFNALFSCN